MFKVDESMFMVREIMVTGGGVYLRWERVCLRRVGVCLKGGRVFLRWERVWLSGGEYA